MNRLPDPIRDCVRPTAVAHGAKPGILRAQINAPDTSGSFHSTKIDRVTAGNTKADTSCGDLDGQVGTIGLTGAEEVSFNVLSFARGTQIKTPLGEIAIEHLKTGDTVLTRDNGLQPIRWMGSRSFTRTELGAHTNLRPIRIARGALGSGLPERDLRVSPQHRVLIRSRAAERMFESSEVLIPAKKLLGIEGVSVAEDGDGIQYFHILCDRHELVWSDGAVTETLQTGEEAVKTLPPEARKEIFAIFPELAIKGFAISRAMARPVPKGAQIRTVLGQMTKDHQNTFNRVA